MKKYTLLTSCVFHAMIADAIKFTRGPPEALECRGARCVLAPGHAIFIRLESPRGCLVEAADLHGKDDKGGVSAWWCLTPRTNVSIAAEVEPEDWRPVVVPASPPPNPASAIVIDYRSTPAPPKLFKQPKPHHIRVYRSVE